MKPRQQRTSGQSNSHAGFWSSPPKKADRAIKYLEDLYNERNPGQVIDLTLNAFIMIVCRLYKSLQDDPNFKGGYNEAARMIRRQLFNHLNLCVLYKEESDDVAVDKTQS